jgi:RimJ/RimL family protein N-acetyltransferase
MLTGGSNPSPGGAARHHGEMPPLRPPELTDGVVRLRERREADSEAVVAAVQDPEIPRWTRIPKDYTRADWDAFVRRVVAEQAAGEGVSLVVCGADDRPLGMVGLHAVDAERTRGELGYWIAREARGRGLAVRALTLLRDWAHETAGVRRLEVLVHPGNAVSRAVARGAGFAETGELRRECHGEDCEEPHVVHAWPAPSSA